jgi:hypothetical protein
MASAASAIDASKTSRFAQHAVQKVEKIAKYEGKMLFLYRAAEHLSGKIDSVLRASHERG